MFFNDSINTLFCLTFRFWSLCFPRDIFDSPRLRDKLWFDSFHQNETRSIYLHSKQSKFALKQRGVTGFHGWLWQSTWWVDYITKTWEDQPRVFKNPLLIFESFFQVLFLTLLKYCSDQLFALYHLVLQAIYLICLVSVKKNIL